MGLDDTMFNTITSQILNMDPLPIVTTAYPVIIKEERHRIIAKNKEICTEAIAFAA